LTAYPQSAKERGVPRCHTAGSDWTLFLVCLLERKNGNGNLMFLAAKKLKFVLLGRQTMIGNRQLLLQTTCPSMPIHNYLSSIMQNIKKIRRLNLFADLPGNNLWTWFSGEHNAK
jgi:hypothetical protein